MVFVEGGTFWMGSDEDEKADDYEKPAHRVTINDFYIGKYEVTQKQWRDVMGSDPPKLYNTGCDQCPVEGVSWDDVQEFIRELNALTVKQYRLPTEAEWEYAARGGNKSQGYVYSGSNNLDEVGWYTENAHNGNTHGSRKTTRPVGTKKSNELDLYDMSGNVWEWCSDWYEDYQTAAQTNPMGPTSGSLRVYRGGSWFGGARGCRVSYRINWKPRLSVIGLGFRLARSV
jgi:formylglycine-generating enzyme